MAQEVLDSPGYKSYDISGHETLWRVSEGKLVITMSDHVLVIESDSPIRCTEHEKDEMPKDVDDFLNS